MRGAQVPGIVKKPSTLENLTMKHLIRSHLALAVLSAAFGLGVHADNPPGYVDFGKFTAAGSGGECIEVNIGGNLISMVARLTEKSEPEVTDLLRGLRSVRVNVIGLTDENRADLEKRMKTIRAELDTQGWQRIVTVQNKGEDVGIFIKTRGEEAVEGVVVTVLSGKHEAVFVNVVGDIKPEKLATLGERLNIEPLKKAAQALKKK